MWPIFTGIAMRTLGPDKTHGKVGTLLAFPAFGVFFPLDAFQTHSFKGVFDLSVQFPLSFRVVQTVALFLRINQNAKSSLGSVNLPLTVSHFDIKEKIFASKILG
jgi:hypothetical protein